ncbi:MAG: alpha/beta hydrolase-fold protein [Actinomycetota bacterium]
MKKILLIIFTVVIILVLSACSTNKAETNQELTEGDAGKQKVEQTTEDDSEEQEAEENIEKEYIINISTPAPSLENNKLGEEGEQTIRVFLPPSYYNSDKKYPVLYYLHGFSESCNSLNSFYRSIKNRMESSELKEFIIVCPTGRTKLGGSFYVNSPITGDWEDHIVKDVVGYVDSNFKTIADSKSRGIAGFSMGGFGSINLALRHPDVFSCLYSFAPGLFDENGLEKAFENNDWDSGFKNAYGAAFSPDTDLPEPYAEIPAFDGSRGDNEIIANWENGFGNLESKLNDYMDKNIELKAIYIGYGKNDRYVWIPEGCRYFSKILDDNGINHKLVELEGGHGINNMIVLENMLPFFAGNF